MNFSQTFESLSLDSLHNFALSRKEDGWRYVQTLAVNKDDGVDLVYSFMKDGNLVNSVISDVPRDAEVPSITDVYLAAFVFENEIHDLFGTNITNIAIDFKGNFYRVSTEYPMTIISPEQLAAREKARKVAEAKAAKERAAADKAEGTAETAAKEDDMEAKLAAMDPEKAAKVRAAMEKKKDGELEEKLAGMDPEKAAKVRAAMEAKAKKGGE